VYGVGAHPEGRSGVPISPEHSLATILKLLDLHHLVPPSGIVSVQADQDPVEIVDVAQLEQAVSVGPGVEPELHRGDIQLQEHVADRELAHDRYSLRSLQVHGGAYELFRDHAAHGRSSSASSGTDCTLSALFRINNSQYVLHGAGTT